MTAVGQPVFKVQNRVIALFRDELQSHFLCYWTCRPDRNITVWALHGLLEPAGKGRGARYVLKIVAK